MDGCGLVGSPNAQKKCRRQQAHVGKVKASIIVTQNNVETSLHHSNQIAEPSPSWSNQLAVITLGLSGAYILPLMQTIRTPFTLFCPITKGVKL